MSVLLGQKNQLWWDISPLDSFSLLAEIYDLDQQKAKARVNELAELLDTKHVLNTQLRRLSLGERMKMEIIGSLLHSPDVLFLDEPTIGLDIVAQTTIRKFISEYVKNQGPTVILTSHYMDDITKLADRLLLISKGNLVYDGTVLGFMHKSKSLQQVSFSLTEPLSDNLIIDVHELKKGEQEFILKVADKDLPNVLSQVTRLQGVHKLKLEEADFEEIIRDFLEKESRILSPGDRHKS